MNTKAIRQLADVTLDKYRSSIPRKAFEEFVKDIIAGENRATAFRYEATPICRASFPSTLDEDGARCTVEVTAYRLNAVAVTAFLLDGPETLLRHIGLDEQDTYTTKHEIDDLNDAIGILKADPDAVIVNGYYCGHFGEDMTIDEIAAGIRWHYEGGRNRLADYCEVTQGRDSLEEGRKAAEAAGLPFCERLADGGDDELSPYVYDGSMALADHEKMQQAREAFEKLADALREIAAKLAEALKPVINAVLSALKKLWKVSAKAIGVPPKWLHLAAHAKKARTRKKYRNRIRRYVFEALAAEGGGGP